jgi:trans-aconitate 2-methyltransferase
MKSHTQYWNSELYQSGHSFVWLYGRDLLGLLDPKAGEQILDVGCGTGQLTAEVAQSGAGVTGVDNSPEMIASARRNFPSVHFEVADVCMLPFANQFDAVVSNAALHWVRDQQSAIRSIAKSLKRGGRFVFEMGGHANLHLVLEAICEALRSLGVEDAPSRIPWYFPTVGRQALLLESEGFDVKLASHFNRPTALEDGEQGFAHWIEMFGGFALSSVRPDQRQELIQRWNDLARPKLFRQDIWTIDYKRLRMVAIKR